MNRVLREAVSHLNSQPVAVVLSLAKGVERRIILKLAHADRRVRF